MKIPFLVLFLPSLCLCQDVVTCNGFVTSEYPLDFSKIVIHLYTKLGTLRETSDCAPTNGFFLIAVYDLGEYTIKIVPPTGWSFEPSEVVVSVNGKTDQCSRGEDIMFHFTGFSITGQVTNLDKVKGPSGVKVELITNDIVVKVTETTADGRFKMSAVLPGEYMIKASHSKWTMQKTSVSIEVTSDNVTVPAGSLVIEGYDVKGYIQSNGEPVAGVQFLLYLQNESESVKLNCTTAGVSSSSSNATPPCVAISESDGSFSYLSLPPGKYRLVPRYENAKSEFQVTPTEVHFSVFNDSVIIKPIFEVHGFTVFGSVLKYSKGEGIEGARVDFGGKLQTVTDKNGHYQLVNVSTGTYTIKVETSHIQFDPVTIDVSPTSPQIPDLVPSKYSVCGHVMFTVQSQPSFETESRTVEVVSDSVPEKVLKTTKLNSKGMFCFMLSPGQYSIRVVISSEEKDRGLLMLPKALPVTVETNIITNLVFNQFSSSISGSLSCLTRCEPVNILLQRLDLPHNRTIKVKITGKTASFNFNEVLPGKYRVVLVSVLQWCWSKESFDVVINENSEPHLIQIDQKGHLLVIRSSHDMHVDMKEGDNLTQSFAVTKGLNNICIERLGDFSIVPRSCHQFDADMYMFLTSLPVPLTITAVSHTVNISVSTPPGNSDPVNISLTIISSETNKDDTQILKPFITNSRLSDDDIVYQYSFNAKPGSVTVIIPQSKKLLCSPEKLTYTIGEDCPEAVPSFHCMEGLFITGHIEPPLAGVLVTIVTNSSDPTIEVITDDKGTYKAGPLPGTVHHTVSATLDQYVFEPLDNDMYSFKAMKKSQLTIKVIDQLSTEPLTGVLVSVSGEDMRSSNKTNEDGTLIHIDISPGQYYIKPLLREFEFQPSSKVIELNQGEHMKVEFTAKRVAFSCSGKVTSLNGTPLEGITVTVLTTVDDNSPCNEFHDVVITDKDGVYRFRGLQPHCDYQISLATEKESSIERGLPISRLVKVTEDDISEENFLAIYKPTKITVTGNIVSNDLELLNLLKVVLYSDKYMESIVYTTTPDPIGFFSLSKLPLNPSREYTVQVESSHSLHKLSVSSITNLSFLADEDKHVTLHVSADESVISSKESAVFKGSFVGLFLAVAAVFGLANIDKVISTIQSYIGNTREISRGGRGR